MANDIHIILSPKVLASSTAQVTLAFDAPAAAENVTIQIFEVDTWGSGPNRIVEPNARDELIAELKGKIVGGKFKLDSKDQKGKSGEKPSLQLHVDGEEKPLFVVHDFPIPSAALANEQGIFEIEARVTATVNKKKKSAKTETPVFVRNFKSGRPIVAFITGGGEDFFNAAEIYWRAVADGMFNIASVESIREILRTAVEARGFGPWGDVNIVSHGNEFEWIVALFKSGGVSHVHTKDVVQARGDQRFSESITSQIDDKSRVIIRGCAIGNDQALLDEIRLLFGGQAPVLAPKFLQTYFTDSSSGTTTGREAFFETFFFYVPGDSAPSNTDCRDRLSKEHPTVNKDDWMPILTRPQRKGTSTPEQIKEQFNGFRHDRTESFGLRFTFTISHPPGKPASKSDGEAVDFIDMARKNWKKDEEHFNTDFDEWKWTQGPLLRRELDANTTEFSRAINGQRHRVEVRRLMRDATGNPVKPDLDNPSHYGRSPPFEPIP